MRLTTWTVQLSLAPPALFPPATAQQLQPEHVKARLDEVRETLCHPLAGIYTDAEWEAYKDECATGFCSLHFASMLCALAPAESS